MTEQSFREKFMAALDATSMSVAELSRRSGVSYDTINKLKRRDGASTRADNAAALAAALGFDYDAGQADAGGETLLPVYNVQASAGHGTLIDGEEIVSSIAFPPGYLKKLTKANPKNLAIIGVKGDSMVPTLHDDDLVMLDTSKVDLSFDGLFVMRDDGDGLLVKRIGRASKRGHIMVISDNRDLYPPIERAAEHIEVVGKVIWMGKKV